MGYEVSYKGDNNGRRAISDMFRYIGLNSSKIVLRAARAYAQITDDVERNKKFNGLCMQIEVFCGVSGEPIRRLFEYVGGADQLASWMNSDSQGNQKVKEDA
jgi:hypothetical protein